MRHYIRASRLALAALLAIPLIGAGGAHDSAIMEPVLTARHFGRGASLKLFNPTGSVRLIGWSHDSLEVHGVVSPRARYYAAGDAKGMKLGVEEALPGAPAAHGDLTIYLPRGTQVAVKTVNGSIDATDVAGWFYTVAGAVRIAGNAATIDVEDMQGDIDLAATAPWMHARAGSGHVVFRGAVTDADLSTISGALDVAGDGIMRGQFSSVTGVIRFAGAPAAGAILDFANHSGTVDFSLPASASATFALSTVTGTIVNGFARIRPVAESRRAVRLTLGRGGADVTVRTFKGAIRLRSQ